MYNVVIDAPVASVVVDVVVKEYRVFTDPEYRYCVYGHVGEPLHAGRSANILISTHRKTPEGLSSYTVVCQSNINSTLEQ